MKSSSKKAGKKPVSNKNSSKTPKEKSQNGESVAVAYSKRTVSKAPQVMSGKGMTRIVHEELLSTIVGSDDFSVFATLPLNPGMSLTFPWLSGQARFWERYRFRKLRFIYSTSQSSGTPGRIMLSPDYDSADAPPQTEREAYANEGAVSDVPWKMELICDLKPSSLHALGPTKFVRSSGLAPNLDIKTYDSGNLHVCTLDGSAIKWGKLMVEYDVELFTPQLNAFNDSLLVYAKNKLDPSDGALLTAGEIDAGSSTDITCLANSIIFNLPGQYWISLFLYGESPALHAFSLSAGSTLVHDVGVIDAAGTGIFRNIQVNVLAGAVLTLADTIGEPGGGAGYCYINSLPSLFGPVVQS